MKLAAPFMSGFVVYLLTLGGIAIALRKAKKNILRARYVAGGSYIIVALVGIMFTVVQQSQNASALT